MDKREVYDELKGMDAQLSLISDRFSHLYESLNELVEENSELAIENQHLRDRIDQIENKAADDSEEHLSNSRKNLEKLYNEGFHVCSQFYGKRREDDESCIFCTDVIYGRR
ncbi:DNA replication initiation control protein YabA [Lentilactobacillus laojiaonis]|uniref:DNA replication initiation control protein YabA n=1 Tax=Lentilactobacillus laojiaonis TaxID=2883998 RepID=UPI001D0A3A0D|nr:DNA replication initiation control protein YabA [Lentilactobacillus laojiaonis]UDM31851.1 DNA replication initiation control protein YabA [Lentilactobacillus laojiaonis]